MTPSSTNIPYGFCHCGCGRKTNLARDNEAPRGRVKGEPMRYIVGHNGLLPRGPEIPNMLPLPWYQYALVSPEDYERLRGFTWFIGSNGYVWRNPEEGEERTLHRAVMQPKPGEYVDHISMDLLDNRREALRICTNSQNNMNRRRQSNNTSGYKGVTKYGHRGWRAYIKLNGKHAHIGVYKFKEDAARAYNEAALRHYGEFALLNVIEGDEG